MTTTLGRSTALGSSTCGTQLGIEDALWETANALRGNLDSSDYKHVVLGLIFLKYLFDADRHPELAKGLPTPGDLRWNDVLRAVSSNRPSKNLDKLIARLETFNPSLSGSFPRFSLFEGLAPHALTRLAQILADTDLAAARQGGRDILSRTYEYFLSKFAAAEGRLGGEFYTPRSIVRLMVGLLEPFFGTVYDPACGTGGLFVQAKTNAEARGGRFTGIRVVGQESNPNTWRLARLNLALHGINVDLGDSWGDTFSQDQHSKVKADFILTNPPFGKGTTWPRHDLLDDERWKFGIPPANPANFAWLQHYVARLSGRGVAVTVMPNGTLTSRGAEGAIRERLVRADLVECVIVLPSQLFYSTPIPVCLWILSKDKTGSDRRRERRGEVLLIDARQLGYLTSKVHRDLSTDDLAQIVDTYHAWQGREGLSFKPRPGFSISRTLDDLAARDYSLNPSEHVVAEIEVDAELTMKTSVELAEESASWIDQLGPASRAVMARLREEQLSLRVLSGTSGEWREVRLGDVAKVVGGGTPSTKNPSFFGGDIAWITPRDLTEHRGPIIRAGKRNLTQEGLDSCGAKLLPEGAVLVSSRAPIGLVALAGAELATNQGIRSVIVRAEDQDPRFWYYLLKASAERLDAAGNGTTFRELRGSALADMLFVVPPLHAQKKIADYLQVLEDAAEAARQTERLLASIISSISPGMVKGLIQPKRV